MHPILSGRTVLEIGSMLSAPFATHILAQLGASVIKIEPPAGDPTRNMFRGGPGGSFIASNHGKRSVCLDLKDPAGRAALELLLARADVVVHNLAPASARSLRLTHADCVAANPRVVFCHIQGYGPGPLADEIASNPVIEASTGVMFGHRINGRPTRLSPSYHDQFAGTYAVIGILAALQAPADDQRARRVELGLYETGLHVGGRDYVQAQLKEHFGVRSDPAADPGEFAMPGYGAHATADGRWLFLLMLTDGHWARFVSALALTGQYDPELDQLRVRKKRRDEAETLVRTALGALPWAEAEARLRAAGVGFTEVRAPGAVLSDPQARQPGKLARTELDGLAFEIPNLPLPNQLAASSIEQAPPQLGEHTFAVLAEAGLSPAECAALEHSGAARRATQPGPKWAPPRHGPGAPP